jgi:O-antigen/teichoic acid export membrane protein
MSQISSPPDIASNAGFAMFSKVLYLASRLLVPPLVLAHISLVEYGLWSAAFLLIMYIGLTDVGFSNVYVRFTARFHAEGDVAAINRLISTGIFTLALLALLVLAVLWLALPLVLDLLKVEAAYHDTATILVMGAAAMFLLDLSLGAYCYLLHGLQRIREEQQVAIVGYLLELVLIALFLQLGMGVYSLLAAFVLRYAWSLSAFIRLAYRFLPGLSVHLGHYDRAMLRHFFGFGMAVQASALVGTLLFSLDRLLAGMLLGPKGIALFELGAKLPRSALSVPAVISNVTLPAAAHHSSSNNLPAIRALYLQASRAIAILSALPLAFMAVFAAPLVLAWLGDQEDMALLSWILALTALWSHLHIITGPGSAVFRAMGQVGNEFVYHGLRFAGLALGIGFALALEGVSATSLALGLTGGSAVAALAYIFHNQRRLALPLADFVRRVLLPGALAYPLAWIAYLGWQQLGPEGLGRWETLAGLLLFGLGYSLAYFALLWLWVLDPSERARLAGLLGNGTSAMLRWRNS